MRKQLLLPFFAVILSLLFGTADAATRPAAAVNDPVPVLYTKLASLTLKQAQQLAGRKFTLREKLGFVLFKKQVRKGQQVGFSKTLLYKTIQKKTRQKANDGSMGTSALAFGIAGLVLLILGLFIPYVFFISPIAGIVAIVLGSSARKKDPDDTNAKLGKTFGWISLGLFAVILIIALIALATWDWL